LLGSLLCRRKVRVKETAATLMATLMAIMNRYLITVSLSLATATTFAQGLVNFYNTSTTLVSTGPWGAGTSINGPPGAYYFALLTSASSSSQGPWVSTGVYATNMATPGIFSGGTGVAVPGLAPGSTFYYAVAGWSANLGHDFNPQWEIGNGFPPSYLNPLYGLSAFGLGVAGGPTAKGTLPPLDLFGGTNGMNTGFNLVNAGPLVPAPTLLIVPDEDNVIVTWSPGPAVGLTLQSTTNLASAAAWTPVSPAPSAQGPFTNRISVTQQFFRFSQ
jgi:hypothetical protein